MSERKKKLCENVHIEESEKKKKINTFLKKLAFHSSSLSVIQRILFLGTRTTSLSLYH